MDVDHRKQIPEEQTQAHPLTEKGSKQKEAVGGFVVEGGDHHNEVDASQQRQRHQNLHILVVDQEGKIPELHKQEESTEGPNSSIPAQKVNFGGLPVVRFGAIEFFGGAIHLDSGHIPRIISDKRPPVVSEGVKTRPGRVDSIPILLNFVVLRRRFEAGGLIRDEASFLRFFDHFEVFKIIVY